MSEFIIDSIPVPPKDGADASFVPVGESGEPIVGDHEKDDLGYDKEGKRILKTRPGSLVDIKE